MTTLFRATVCETDVVDDVANANGTNFMMLELIKLIKQKKKTHKKTMKNTHTKTHCALNVSDLHTKMTTWSFTTGEAVHFIMDAPGDGNESDEEKRVKDDPDDDSDTDSNYPEVSVDAKVDPYDDSDSDSNYPQVSVDAKVDPDWCQGWPRWWQCQW